jgi:hypothetical protein
MLGGGAAFGYSGVISIAETLAARASATKFSVSALSIT